MVRFLVDFDWQGIIPAMNDSVAYIPDSRTVDGSYYLQLSEKVLKGGRMILNTVDWDICDVIAK